MSAGNSTRRSNRFKHGHAASRSREYEIWKGMRARCNNPNHVGWKWYGGKGIKVCDRWSGRDGFINFLNDMGPAPTPNHTIDRRRSSDNYEPGNCRWATRKEQGRNTGRNIVIEHNGRKQCVQAWLDEFGIPMGTYLSRLHLYGWDRARAATTTPRRASA